MCLGQEVAGVEYRTLLVLIISSKQFPLFQHALPLLRLAEVHAGDVLYLPSLWLHHVEQQRAADGTPCIALNWW